MLSNSVERLFERPEAATNRLVVRLSCLLFMNRHVASNFEKKIPKITR